MKDSFKKAEKNKIDIDLEFIELVLEQGSKKEHLYKNLYFYL